MALRIEQLNRSHERSIFDCGEPTLNNYLQRLAMQHDERHIGRTYVAVEEGDPRVLGYYTLAAGRVAFETVPNNHRLPPHVPVPVVLIGRLAVDLTCQGTGLGERLLIHALWRIQQIARQAGVYAVEVDALNDKAVRFYARYGFTPLSDDPHHLYLSMRTVDAIDFSAVVTAEEIAKLPQEF